MNAKFRKQLVNLLFILAGNTIYALGIVMFILPNHLITGGTTGLALSADHYFHIPITAFVFCFNLLMFLLGGIVLGKAFALTTLISTFYYPIILGVLQSFPGLSDFTDNPMLATVCGGILIGFGIGIVIRAGASTGGMDIPPLVLNKKFGLPISGTLYAFDFTILLLQILFSNKEQVLYGILLIIIYTFVLDKVLLVGSTQTEVKIISSEFEKINQAITETMDRGSTLLHATTGYQKNEQQVILVVVSNREFAALEQLVLGIDPKAFMIVARAHEVKGRGFSLQKEYQ